MNSHHDHSEKSETHQESPTATTNEEYGNIESSVLRAVQKIVKYIHSEGATHVTKEHVFQELYRVLGSDFMTLSARVKELSRRMDVDETMDFKFSDVPEPIVLSKVSEEAQKSAQNRHVAPLELSDEELIESYRDELNQPQYEVDDLAISSEGVDARTVVRGHRRFGQSYTQYMNQLKSQRQVMSLFKAPDPSVDPGDFEFPSPIRLVYDEEKPSYKDIEAYRGDRDPELTDADRAAQQALSYIQKRAAYFEYIANIKNIKQIPFKTERLLMLENFRNYLVDARYYIKFYQQYSHYWAPQATRTIVPYKGMYVPLEKRKEEETYHFGQPVSQFKPLRKLIYQDFHNKVRNGEPPSFDLDGKLPTLAMYYARTTFVPPMSDEEMQQLFYPDRVLDRNGKPYLDQLNAAILSKTKQKPKRDPTQYFSQFLDQFQTTYTTRNHILQHINRPFCSSYKTTSGRYSTLTGERLLNNLNRLFYLFGGVVDRKTNDFPQSHDCIILLHSSSMELAQQASVEYVLLLCFALVCGIPVVTLNVTNENLIEALGSASNYCSCGLLCTFDEHILSILCQREHNSVCQQLGLQHILYYGDHEPKARINSVNGSSCVEDPVSNILKPTIDKPMEQTYENSSLWQYLPLEASSAIFQLHQYKSSMASTKGISDALLEDCRYKVLERSSKLRSMRNVSHPPAMLIQQGDRTMVGVDMDKIMQSITRVETSLSSILHTIKQKSNSVVPRVAQVLIALPSNHPLFHFWILFCFKQSLSFCFVSVSELNTLQGAMKHISTIKPQLLIADTHTTNSITLWMQSPQWTHSRASTSPNILDNNNILQIDMGYRGLLEDMSNSSEQWIKSNILKAVQNTVSNMNKHSIHLDMISVGYNILSPTLVDYHKRTSSRLFHAIPSEAMFGPVLMYDSLDKDQVEGHSYQDVGTYQSIPEINSYEVWCGDLNSLSCLSRSEREYLKLSQFEILESLLAAVFNSESLHNDDAANLLNLKRLFDDIQLPQDCRRSFAQFLNMKRELIFYDRVQQTLRSRSIARRADSSIDVTAVSSIEHALFSALLDELSYVTIEETMAQITYDDVMKFLQLRIDLTIEALKLQIIDFRNRFYRAKRSKRVLIDTKVDISGPELVEGDSCHLLRDIVAFGPSRDRLLLCPVSHILVLPNDAVINCSLVEHLYETESDGLVQRVYVSRSYRPNEPLQAVVQRHNHVRASQIMLRLPDINKRVKEFYESIIGVRPVVVNSNSQWLQLKSMFAQRSTGKQEVCTISLHGERAASFLLPFTSRDIHSISNASSLGSLSNDLEFNPDLMEQMFGSALIDSARHLYSRL